MSQVPRPIGFSSHWGRRVTRHPGGMGTRMARAGMNRGKNGHKLRVERSSFGRSNGEGDESPTPVTDITIPTDPGVGLESSLPG